MNNVTVDAHALNGESGGMVLYVDDWLGFRILFTANYYISLDYNNTIEEKLN